MTVFQVLWGLVLTVGGALLARFGIGAMRHRPGWGGQYGKGALVLLLGGFLVIGGVVGLIGAVTS